MQFVLLFKRLLLVTLKFSSIFCIMTHCTNLTKVTKLTLEFWHKSSSKFHQTVQNSLYSILKCSQNDCFESPNTFPHFPDSIPHSKQQSEAKKKNRKGKIQPRNQTRGKTTLRKSSRVRQPFNFPTNNSPFLENECIECIQIWSMKNVQKHSQIFHLILSNKQSFPSF
jgi:hypothetical protein